MQYTNGPHSQNRREIRRAGKKLVRRANSQPETSCFFSRYFCHNMNNMEHQCGRDCPCRKHLDDAAAALAEASRLLSESIMISSDDLIDSCYALVRAAKARVQGARAAYLDHLAELVAGPSPNP
jgi:hypothetical protein